ncbi:MULTISPECIES: TetR/AcrR family transcriptional regulator [Methylomonas]|uniref:TetR/AcrR family transcriptional regulator n=1 Tax=Methylomonas TaxID=416 RepID=UPI0012326D45|nr:TetR/AcrR family transcriptional regulator [Methylomonas rhizoryzae]
MTRDLRLHILNTASDLFYSQGIKATGVDAIVKAAGTTKMSLYKYFPSKDDLVLAHLHRSGDTMRAKILAGIQHQGMSPAQQLLAVFDVFAEMHSNPAFRGCPFINATAEFADGDSPVAQAVAEFYLSLQTALTELAKQAGCDNPETLAEQILMLLAGATVRAQMQTGLPVIPAAKQAAEMLLAAAAT